MMDKLIDVVSNYSETYEIKIIKNKTVISFDNHNMALPIWGEYSNLINKQCQLITFDTHCDISTPFSKMFVNNNVHVDNNYFNHECVQNILMNKKYMFDNFVFSDVYDISNAHIMNYEHIKTAYDWRYINKYILISSEKNMGKYIKDDQNAGYICYGYKKNNWKRSILNSINCEPILLDFDLDFFNCENDFINIQCNELSEIIKQSEIITIAKEPDYFEKCKSNPVDFIFTNEKAHKTLLSIINDYS